MTDVIDTVLAGKSLNDLETVKQVSNNVPEVTSEKVEAAVSLLKEVEKNNGHRAIAREVGLNQVQVASIHRKMDEKIKELSKK